MLPQAIVYPFALLAAVLVAWRAVARGRPAPQALARALLALYLGWIISMTFFPLPTDPAIIKVRAAKTGFHANLVPFHTIVLQAEYESTWQKVRQLGGNVLVFVPFGVLLPWAAPGFARLRRLLLAGIAFSVAIELGQLAVSAALGYTYRVSDVDDVILNVTGVLLGYAAYRLVGLARQASPASPAPPHAP
jgi:glycopeptide antibiotics resistance protein